MKIIDTFWEKRNLGCDSVEIRCEHEDESLDIARIKSLKQPYQVMKIPCSRGALLPQAQSLGFMVVECQVLFKTNVNDLCPPRKYERLVKDVSYHMASEDEISETLRKVSVGNIFTTDRIAMDPAFSAEIAGKRYANWVKDLLGRGYLMYIQTYKGEAFGWFIANINKGEMTDVPLGGNFREKSWVGMGIAGNHITMQAVKEKGAKGISYGVSTNNLAQIKATLEFGSKIEDIQYVLVKHVNG